MEQVYKTLLEAFENSVLLHREKNALVVQGEALTYEEIYNIAHRQAFLLLKKIQKKRLKRVAIFA